MDAYDDEGLVCGACFARLDRRVEEHCGCEEGLGDCESPEYCCMHQAHPTCTCTFEDEADLIERALGCRWQRVYGRHGEHWYCPRHTLAVRAVDAVLPTSERVLLRGLVAVVEVVAP